MLLAERAGIRVFATGGVGGVHRGAEHTFDISADLVELGRTPTAVVCAGVKSILDIPKTLEFLETQRVPVIAFGTDEFPAFYTPHSGQKAGLRLDTPEDLARAIALHHRLGAGTGLLIANPIPPDDAWTRRPWNPRSAPRSQRPTGWASAARNSRRSCSRRSMN